jgi:hypothetical protein
MPKVLVVAKCKNLVKWEQGFRTHAELFRSMGVTKPISYGTSGGNFIAVCSETNDVAVFMKVLEASERAAAMADDGILRDTVKVFVLDKELQVQPSTTAQGA